MRRRPAYRSAFLFFLIGFLLGALVLWLWQSRGPTGAEATALATFRAAFEITHGRYVEKDKTDPTKLAYDAINGMVQGLGDTGHSRFLTPEQRQREQQSLSGTFVGIGVELAERNGRPVVVTAIPGSPAARAGLRPGDRILRANGEDISSLSLAAVGERLRGPEGSSVSLTVLHTDNQVIDVTVRREQVHLPFVTWAPLAGGGLWHIRITQFGQGTAVELGRALTAAQGAGATGIVLDLRDNPGGLLDEAVGVVSRFVRSGVVLIERNRSGATTPVTVQGDVGTVSLPLALLINAGSASASEVVSAALLYHQRAVAIGETTFGTGTVLRTFGLPDGSALLLGVEEWLTPAGEPLRNRGVTPTEIVPLPQGVQPLIPPTPSSSPEQPCTGQDAQLRAAAVRLGLVCAAG